MKTKPAIRPASSFVFNDITRLFRKRFAQNAQTLPLTYEQVRILFHLQYFDGIRQAALADMLQMQAIVLSRSLDRMAEIGLVARLPDPTDRRAVRLSLGSAAVPTLEQINTAMEATKAEANAGLTQAEMAAIGNALEKIKRNLAALVNENNNE